MIAQTSPANINKHPPMSTANKRSLFKLLDMTFPKNKEAMISGKTIKKLKSGSVKMKYLNYIQLDYQHIKKELKN